FSEALFFGHLYLEKLCKALWVKNNTSDDAPMIHNLLWLLDRAGIKASNDDLKFLDDLNRYQLKGRYPDYLNEVRKITTEKLTTEFINQINRIGKWLISQLP